MTRSPAQRLTHPGPRPGAQSSAPWPGPRHGHRSQRCEFVAKKGGPTVHNEPLPSAIVELGRLVERRMHRALSDHGVTSGQFMALVHIGGRPGISRADLARGLQLSPQAAGGLTSQLFDLGLIDRAPSRPGLPVAFFATGPGLDLLEEATGTLEAVTQEILRCFRPNLAAALDGGVRHLLTKLS